MGLTEVCIIKAAILGAALFKPLQTLIHLISVHRKIPISRPYFIQKSHKISKMKKKLWFILNVTDRGLIQSPSCPLFSCDFLSAPSLKGMDL